jgi:hypothetical protein
MAVKELTGLSRDCIGVGRAIHACSEVWSHSPHPGACMAITWIPGAFYAARNSTLHAEAGTGLDVQSIAQR